MRTITLEDRLINIMTRVSLDRAKPLLSVLESDLTRRFNYVNETKQAISFTEKIIGHYGGIYLALKQDLKKDINNPNFRKKYFNFIACEATLQKFGMDNLSFNQSQVISPMQYLPSHELNEVIKSVYNLTASSKSIPKISQNINQFLRNNSTSLVGEMSLPIFNQEKQIVEDWAIKGNGFEVSFNKLKQKIIQGHQQNINNSNLQEKIETHVRTLRPHNLNPLKQKDIFGNEDAISLVNNEVPCLFAYDNLEKRNPFLGFSSYLMFVGLPGTGKTMLARYAMSLGKSLAEKYHKPLSLVQLDIKDSWKNGSYLNLESQFQEINKGDKIYMVFIDEIDKALAGDQDQGAVEQFLKFRGGAEYNDKGNYIILSTTNNPEVIHKGIMRSFNILNIEGPKTIDDKINLLRNNLQGTYLKINSWDSIYDAFSKYDLTGSDISKIAERTKMKSRRLAKEVSLIGSATDIEYRIQELMKFGNPKYLANEGDILNAISFQIKGRESVRGYA